jgi:PKD repeat protein
VVKHRYAKAGTYTVTLQVSDNFGQHSSSARQIRIK